MERFIERASLLVSPVSAEVASQPPKKPLLVIGLLTLVYFITGKFGLMLASLQASASPVWPPAGIALAALLVLGYRAWPAIFVGAFLVNATTAGNVATSLAVASGNTLEAVCGAWLVNRFAGGTTVFDRPQGVVKFALAVVVSTIISPAFGVTSLALAGFADWTNYGAIWLTWWLGDMAGVLVLAPVLYLWAADRRGPPPRLAVLELVPVLAAMILVGGVVFGGLVPAWASGYPLEFLCIPPLVFAAFRFGQREAATCVALLALLAILGTLAGHGPFARDSQNESLLLLQAFMMTLTIVTIPLAAVVREHERTEAALAHTAAIVAYSDDAIIGKTLEGIITSWNEGAERLYGYTPVEAIGRPISLIIPPELGHELPAILEQLRRGERIEHFETRRVAKNGRPIEVSVTVSPVRDARDRIVGASSIARDITHRKRIEAAMRERDTLRSVASLAAGAAHEINNPLAVVMGQAQLLTDEVGGTARQRIAEILEALDRIRAIVARMRHLTRVELHADAPGLPPMLDLGRSSEPQTEPPVGPPADPARSGWLVVVARDGPARYESLHGMFAGSDTEVIVDRRLGERRRSGADASGGRRRESRRRHDVGDELRTRGWALVAREVDSRRPRPLSDS
jgi:PAS domain S-box-containing protein